MSLLNLLPETYLFILLFLALVVINFRVLTHRSLSAFVSAIATVGLIYFASRPDLAYYVAPIRILASDSFSYFGKILSLGALAVFSLGFYFHRDLTLRSKQNTNLFLILYALFSVTLFQANHLVLILGAALGIYLCSVNLILIEADRDEEWVLFLRQRALPLGLWAMLVAFLFGLGTFLFGSVYLSEWIGALAKHNISEISLFIFAFLFLLMSAIPLAGLRCPKTAPLGISVSGYGIFLILAVLWIRLGVPFFSLSGLLSKNYTQILLSLGLGTFALRYAWLTLRTREHHRWYAAALPTNVCLGLFFILLTGEQSMPAFYSIAISLLFTFGLAGHAFLDDQYRHKGVLIIALVALVGAPPLILGEQIYRMVRDSVSSDNLAAGLMIMLAWFLYTLAGMQMIGKILLIRNSLEARRKIFSSEVFFVSLYLGCVIALTAFRPSIVTFLNEHPPSNLW